MLTSEQLRAARSLLGWSQDKLALTAGVSLSTVKRMEQSRGPVRGNATNVWKAQRALEEAGVVFIKPDDGGGPGARLRSPIEP